jgi:hypothetical protein
MGTHFSEKFGTFTIKSTMRIKAYLSFLFSAFLLLGCIKKEEKVEKLIESANEKAEKGDFKGAVVDLNQALGLDNTYTDAYRMRG